MKMKAAEEMEEAKEAGDVSIALMMYTVAVAVAVAGDVDDGIFFLLWLRAGSIEDIDRFSKRTVSMTGTHQEDCKRLLRLMGIPVVEVRCLVHAAVVSGDAVAVVTAATAA